MSKTKEITGKTIGTILSYTLNLILISPVFITIYLLFDNMPTLELWLSTGIIMMILNYISHVKNQ